MNTEPLILLVCELTAKSSAILLAAFLLERAWSRSSAAQRHLIWCAAFAALLFLPLTRLVTPRWRVPIQRVTVRPAPPALSAPLPGMVSPNLPTPAPAPAPWQWPDGKTIAVLAWAGVATLLLLRRL